VAATGAAALVGTDGVSMATKTKIIQALLNINIKETEEGF